MTGIKERLRIIFDVLRMLPAIAVKPPKLEAAVSIGGIFEATQRAIKTAQCFSLRIEKSRGVS
jgi:hypothetical protein